MKRPIIDTFGTRLYVARTLSGLNRSELADRIGARHQRVADWETGAHSPRNLSEVVAVTAPVLDVDPEWLEHGGRLLNGEAKS